MSDSIESVAIILFGLVVIVFRKWQARKYAEWQTNTFGRHVPAWETKFGEKMAIVVGIFFIISGIITLANPTLLNN